MKETIGIGIIGAGFARTTQIPGFKNCKDARLVAIASAHRDHAEQVAREFEVKKPNSEPGDDLIILGNSSIGVQLSEHRLIDEYQMVMNAIVPGGGRTMFEGPETETGLKPTRTRTCENGNVLS